MSFKASCHCGRIRLTVDAPLPTEAMACNCSICARKAYLHHFTTPDQVRIEADAADIASYGFNTHVIRHHFCRTCGCATHADGTAPDGRAMIDINLRCVEGLDPATLAIQHYDGAAR